MLVHAVEQPAHRQRAQRARRVADHHVLRECLDRHAAQRLKEGGQPVGQQGDVAHGHEASAPQDRGLEPVGPRE